MWTPPVLDIARLEAGDMPGDQIRIDESHVKRANTVFPLVLGRLVTVENSRLIISVYGGSGVGKSEIGSILSSYCRDAGCPAYLMSGDNYPHRYPAQNEDERLNTYRSFGLAGISADSGFEDSWIEDIQAHWEDMSDSDPSLAKDHKGFSLYQNAGRRALTDYLGSEREINFNLVNSIIDKFKSGSERIPLKRMGRTRNEVYFEVVDFSGIHVLILEWTHGNSPYLHGIDIPIFLYSSPEETLEHRRSRGRDANVDSAFTRLVLDIEQGKLSEQASKSALIVGKDGTPIPPGRFPGERA